MDSQHINDILKSIMDALPDGVKNIPADLEVTIKAALERAFNRLDLVSREEFDVQAKVLEKTREKLEVLEQKIVELEKEHSSDS